MKHARKLTSLLLALVMVFALAVTAFATETGATTTTGTITVANPVEGQTYTAYKVFDVTYDKNGHYSYTLPAFPTDDNLWYMSVRGYATIPDSGLIKHVVGTPDAETGAESIFFTTDENFSPADFAVYLKGRLGYDHPTGHELTKQEDGTVSVSNLPLGYYFVTSSAGALCSLDTTNPNVIIRDKNDMPFKKEVNTPSADVGQPVTFTITGEVPEHTAFTTYTYEITDTMSKGLTFKKDTLKVKIGSQDVTAGADTYTLTDPTASDSFTFKLTIKVKNYTVGDNIVVTYDATVNDQAIAEISKNNAVLKYSNDPNTDELGTSVPQEVPVYTSQIVIIKHETDKEDVLLPNAEFVLYKEVTPTGGSSATKYYYKWNDTDEKVEWVENKAEATVVKTDMHYGRTYFFGLANGTYYLVETKAPAGYNRLEEPYKVEVKGGTTEAELSVTAKVANSAGTLLPSTGGMGTTIFYVLGFVLVVGAGVLLVTKKRMSQSEI